MPAFDQGILLPSTFNAQVPTPVYYVALEWFVNRCPMVTRLPRVPVGKTTFDVAGSNFRARSTTLGAAVANNTTTSVTLADASPFMMGDVLELASGERIEITADPTVSSGVCTVRRGVEGTTAAAQNNTTTVVLIGNSRTGGEVFQKGTAYKPTASTQYCQTFQFPVQVSGSAQAETAFVGSAGAATPYDAKKMEALQNLLDDMEYTSYYGIGEAPAVGGRPKQVGVKYQIPSGNRTVGPVNASAYKATDLIRDTIEKCRSNGGNPDVLVVSTNFITGFSTWGHAIQRLDAGATAFGTPIDLFYAPFVGGLTIIEAPLLKSFTAFCLTSSEVQMRMKRNEFFNPRGIAGDAFEGDFIAEGAIQIENSAHHAWVEGITAFAA